MAVSHGSRLVMEKIGMKHTDTDFPKFSNPISGFEHGEARYQVARSDWTVDSSEPCEPVLSTGGIVGDRPEDV